MLAKTDIGMLVYCPRSGSTKLAHELAPTGILVIPEFRSFEWLLSRATDTIDHAEFQRVWTQDPQTDNLGIDIPSQKLGTGGDVLSEIAQAYLEAHDIQDDRPIVLFKFGWGVSYREQAVQAFGADMPCIALVRDGRAVVNSMLKSVRPYAPHTSMGRDDVWFSANLWRRHLLQLESGWVGTHKRLAFVRFEELTDRPEEILTSIGAALRDESRSPAAGGSEFSVADIEGDIHALVSGPLDSSRVDAWRSELSTADQALVSHMLATELSRLGYSAEDSSVGAVALQTARAKHYFKQARFALLSAVVAVRGGATGPALQRMKTRVSRLQGPGGAS